MKYFYNNNISLFISTVVTAVLTYVLSFKFEAAPAQIADEQNVAPQMLKANTQTESVKTETGKIYAPLKGEVISLEDIGDGIEIMVHVGSDTVALNRDGFDVKVKAGQRVNCGQLLRTGITEKSKSIMTVS